MRRTSLRATAGSVRAWHASTTDLADPVLVEQALTWLSPVEHDRYRRFRGDDDRRMFLLGRVMARLLVGRSIGVRATTWKWHEGPHGRPEIGAPVTPVRFNLAHSAGLVVCAVGSGRDVGVDVEDLDRRRIDPAVVRRYCSPHEIADIDGQGADGWHDRFLVYWTLKEAYLKARGVGISLPLSEISFTLATDEARIGFIGSLSGTDDRWVFHLTQPTERHLVAVAASTADGVTPVFTVERLALEDFLNW